MARFCSMPTLCIAVVIGCSSTEPPTGPLTGDWAWHGPDSNSNYVNLALTQAGNQVRGTMQFCRPTMCGGQAVSSPYTDSAFAFDLGMFLMNGNLASASLSGRLLSTDTVVAVLANFWQQTIDTLVFLRAGGAKASRLPRSSLGSMRAAASSRSGRSN